ncbi:hypothetical protein IQ230_04120 [Gloeocapsopsis crepidinum LEGE 06123]|uniref:MnmC-like methyltransferase domain-containing protein n=1 Tax=Gloeocapsopsis crepidinum LEGE 06123 TaxID=588587 RepID=A0ABR9UMS6_9CHRO|nr:MnmC family methyltransferase [Gloeocapsopsis crepidinum]MBE9189564.1 hypothetical protein [Gloeocapsopsis crepidinum LEGE 06123]
MPDAEFIPQATADGSFTFFSKEFDEAFHSQYGARQEAEKKFVEPTQLQQKAQQPRLRLLDICYGLGYNTAAALATIWQVNPSCSVEVIALESNLGVPQAAIAHKLLQSWCQPVTQLLTQLATEHQIQTNNLKAKLIIGDARKTIQELHQAQLQAEAIFLDPFSPPHCPQLWTVEFLQQVALCLAPDGRLATYSCAAAVRTALIQAGLKIGSTPPVGRRSPGTVAAWAIDLPALSSEEQEHLLTRAAIPYRDPQLSDPASIILQRRQQEQNASSLMSTSQWKQHRKNQ